MAGDKESTARPSSMEERCGTLRQVEAIERGCRGSVKSVILPECGHSPHRDQEARALREITAFVGDDQEPAR